MLLCLWHICFLWAQCGTVTQKTYYYTQYSTPAIVTYGAEIERGEKEREGEKERGTEGKIEGERESLNADNQQQ